MEATALLHLAAGTALVLLAWLVPRRIARARRARLGVLLLDFAPIAFGAMLLGFAAGRPLFAGVVALALGAGFALADYTMRQTLREPVVFSEAVELPQVFTHPHLYLPFAGPGLVLGGAAGAVALALALLIVEPPLWQPRPLLALAALALIAAGAWLLSREPLLGTVARNLCRHAAPTGEPDADATALGPFAMLLVHTVIARSERPARQRALAPGAMPNGAPQGCHSGAARSGQPGIHIPEGGVPGFRVSSRGDGPGMTVAGRGPIIVVQCESFFDARRLSPLVPREFLAGFERCCASASRFGRLEVPGWGANTMRAEFAVLTGIPEAELGYDRFNPYYALARVPLDSHVWRLRREGYRTLCLHPFDRRFFRRDLAMPALGFEHFLGRETLGGSRTPPYYPDPELARDILKILDRDGPDTFIFAITMGNHGPWMGKGPPLDPAVAGLFDPRDIPNGAGLLRYLDGLKRSDEMLQLLVSGLERRDLAAVLVFYGDHLPSLPGAFAHFGFTESSSDYVIWDGSGAAQRHDLPAHELGGLALDCVRRELRQPDADPRQGERSACLTPAAAARLTQ